MRGFRFFGGILTVFFLLFIVFSVVFPRILATKSPQSSLTLQTDENKKCTYLSYTLSTVEGAVVLEKEGENIPLVYTDFSQPTLVATGEYLAVYSYPDTTFFVIHLPSAKVNAVEANMPISALKLAQNGRALAISHRQSKVCLFDREGALILTLETQLLLCDAALSNSGKRVGILLVSEKTKAGYIAEIYRAKNGQRLASADFQYSGFPEAYMAGGRLFLVGQKGSFGYLWYGKIHLFAKTP